jgi:hypothetical protein
VKSNLSRHRLENALYARFAPMEVGDERFKDAAK